MEYLDNKHQLIEDTSKIKTKPKISLPDNTKTVSKVASKTPAKSKVKTDKKPDKLHKARSESFFNMHRVTSADKMMFLDNLSTMIKAGLALAPALVTLTKETKNKRFQQVLEHLSEMTDNGQALSEGMRIYPKIFEDMIISTIEVGESTGRLAESMEHLANILKAQRKLRSKVVGALMYPSIVLIALIGISLFLAFSVFPQLIEVFHEADVELPLILVAVQAIINAFTNYGLYMSGTLVVVIVAVGFVFRLPGPKFFLHGVLLRLPLVGNITKEICLTRFSSNLGALLAAGVSIVRALSLVADTLPNLHYRKAVLAMGLELEKGVSLAKSMGERPNLFPSLTVQLCHVGEETGELENILTKIAEFYDERVNNILTNLSTTIEPVLLLLVGGAVGFIALSVISPMYELTQSFAQ